nr:MAG: hypothetical protein [Yunnan farmland noda-like virus]
MAFCGIVPAYFLDAFEWCVGSSSYERHVDMAISEDLSRYSRSSVKRTQELRSAFAKLDVQAVTEVAAHSHGKSAADRSSGSALIATLGPSLGMRVVNLQGSAADERDGAVYTRHTRWGKDLTVTPAQVEKRDNDLTAMVDVDYYVDMRDHLARNFRPLVLYTLQPSQAARSEGEYKYCFDADNRVRYTVSGGATYRHPVWNWKGDAVSATRSMCGIPLTYSVFSLERRNTDPDHQLILVSPLKKFFGVRAWLAKLRAQASDLVRLQPVDGDYVRLQVNAPDGMRMSTARVGGYLSATVPVTVDEAVASAARTMSKITHATVKAKMTDVSGEKSSTQGSEILLEYHQTGGSHKDEVSVLNWVRPFQWVSNYREYEPEKPAMESFMKPLLNEAFVPDRCRNNDQRMVDERVVKLKKPETRPPSKRVVDAMRSFARRMRIESGSTKLHPVEVDVVYEKQSRPSQRRILDEAQHGARVRKAEVMQKNEAYQNVNDPRPITMINGVDKMEYSQYMYAFAEVLKGMKWYAFGKTPKKVARRVAKVCGSAKSHVDSTDFSRQDGRVNATARLFERIIMLELFDETHHVEMLQLMRNQTCLLAKTVFKVTYDTGMARASGSPETSAFNTALNAFIAYLGFRFTNVDGAYLTDEQAWSRLGVYGGDDGLTADQSKQAVERAALIMGQVMTCERYTFGSPGVNFLARHYGPDVWHNTEGSDNSCCDIRRQLSKFHVSVRLPGNVSRETKLKEKAYAFYLTDSETPIIGHFVSAVVKHHKLRKYKYQNLLGIWNSDISQQDQYPNTEADWMWDLFRKQLPEYDEIGFLGWIQKCDKSALMDIPRFYADLELVKKPGLVAVDGDFQGEPLPKVEPKIEKITKRKWHRGPRTNNGYRKATGKTASQRNKNS